MRKLLTPSLIVIAMGFAVSSSAQEPRWWTEMKRNCRVQGGQISDYYNSYTGCHLPSKPPSASERTPPGPHLIWNEEDKAWQPEPGYGWVNHSDDKDLRVMPIPPHVRWNEEDRKWQPEHGYDWVNRSDDNDLRVMRIPPHVRWNEEDNKWQPEPGFDWVDSSNNDDYRVIRVPTAPSVSTPHVPAASSVREPDVPTVASNLVGTYVFVACHASGDASDECSRSFDTATDALTDAMAEEAVSGASKRMLTVHFPSVFDKAEQIKFLHDLENKAIALVQLKINADIKKLGVFSTRQPSFYEVQAEIARDAILVNKIHRQAVDQANSGMNWDHDWGASTHRFRSSAYDQAVQIHFSSSFP